jgi:hypothetical protein
MKMGEIDESLWAQAPVYGESVFGSQDVPLYAPDTAAYIPPSSTPTADGGWSQDFFSLLTQGVKTYGQVAIAEAQAPTPVPQSRYLVPQQTSTGVYNPFTGKTTAGQGNTILGMQPAMLAGLAILGVAAFVWSR